MSKLADMRKGIREHKIIKDFLGTGKEVAIVALNTNEIVNARQNAMEITSEVPTDMDTADLILNSQVLYAALRNVDDLEELFLENYEDLLANTTPVEIYELHSEYIEIQNGKAPEIEDMTEKEFEDLKKKLEAIPLRELDGELQSILKYCHLTYLSENSQTVN